MTRRGAHGPRCGGLPYAMVWPPGIRPRPGQSTASSPARAHGSRPRIQYAYACASSPAYLYPQAAGGHATCTLLVCSRLRLRPPARPPPRLPPRRCSQRLLPALAPSRLPLLAARLPHRQWLAPAGRCKAPHPSFHHRARCLQGPDPRSPRPPSSARFHFVPRPSSRQLLLAPSTPPSGRMNHPVPLHPPSFPSCPPARQSAPAED